VPQPPATQDSAAIVTGFAKTYGGTTRDDQVQLGRMVVEALMKGMSGAPVLSGNFTVGVVSARYNSADEWARNSVWVTRTEDLTPLLAGLDGIVAPRTSGVETAMSGILGGQGLVRAARH
jgi:hypothetical protein